MGRDEEGGRVKAQGSTALEIDNFHQINPIKFLALTAQAWTSLASAPIRLH